MSTVRELVALDSRLSETQRAELARYREQLLAVLRAVWADRPARLSILLILGFIVLAVFAPVLAPYQPGTEFLTQDGQPKVLEPPSLAHPLGTTSLARDVLSQLIYGTRVSLIVGALSGLSVMVVGTTVGLIAGYYKGTVDLVVMRVVDVLYGIPATPLILVFAMFFGNSIWNIILAMVLVLWRTMARVIRSEVLSLSEQPFVKAARATGASDLRIMFVHIAPNLLPLVFIETTIVVGWSIVLEAGISFLGLGATGVSWGTMLQQTFNTGAIRTAWWWVIPPGLCITLLVLAVFYLSRAIESITNPEVTRYT